MNLLQIQDALKGASDQQLVQEMQQPTGMAPQYLVLSELDRRRHMRAQVQGKTPDTTVADDAVAGISALAPKRMIDPDVEDQRRDEDEVSAFREGGAVHMFDGGEPPLSRGEMSRQMFRSSVPTSSISRADAAAMERDILLRSNPALANDPSFISNLADQYGVSVSDISPQVPPARFISPPPERPPFLSAVPAGGASVSLPPQATGMTPDYGESNTPPDRVPNPFVAAAPSGGTPNAQAAPGSSQQGSGIDSLRRTGGGAPAAPGGAAAAGGLPSWEDIRNRVAGNTPNELASMAEEIRRGRPNEGERRNEALNMALMEAGLRIAGSQSPHLAQAISEGAVPAMQGYSRAIGDIRKDMREASKDELEVRMAQITNMYRAGQIGASLFNIYQDSYDKELDRRSGERRTAMTTGSAAEDRAEARATRAATATADREARVAAASEAQTTNTLRVLSDQIKNDRETVNSAIFRARPESDRKPIEDRLNRTEQQYNSIMRHRLSSVPGAVVDWNEFRAGNR